MTLIGAVWSERNGNPAEDVEMAIQAAYAEIGETWEPRTEYVHREVYKFVAQGMTLSEAWLARREELLNEGKVAAMTMDEKIEQLWAAVKHGLDRSQASSDYRDTATYIQCGLDLLKFEHDRAHPYVSAMTATGLGGGSGE